MLMSLRRRMFIALLVYERLRDRNQRRGAILTYHRVATPASDPWRIAVSPENFAAHMDVLKRRGDARCLTELAGRLASDGLADRTVAVTFDDAYADNLSTALPILEEREIPATIFAVSGLIGVVDGFWWDFLNVIFLETETLPETLSVTASTGSATWTLGDDATSAPSDLARHATWVADEEPPRNQRQKVFLEVWELLVALDTDERRGLLAEIADWAGVAAAPQPGDTSRPVTEAELRRLAASPLIDIGGHTASHGDLSGLSGDHAETEIRKDRAALAEITGQAIEGFAYPFGRFAPQTARQIADAGYTIACNRRYRIATPAHDPYHLPRLQVPNISGADFARRLDLILGPGTRSPAPELTDPSAGSETVAGHAER